MPTLPHIDPAVVNGLFLLAGVLITALSSLVAPWLIKSAEDKRAVRMLAVIARLEMWRMHCNLMMEKAKLMSEGKINMDGEVYFGPADPFVGHTMRLVAIATNQKLSPVEAANQIKALPIPEAKLPEMKKKAEHDVRHQPA